MTNDDAVQPTHANAHEVGGERARAEALPDVSPSGLTKPQPPSGCAPAALMVAGPIVGLLTMCGGVVNSLTPPDETIDFATFQAVDAPAHVTLEITEQGNHGLSCAVKGPKGVAVPVTQIRRDEYSVAGSFTTGDAGTYEIRCPKALAESDSSVTNPEWFDLRAHEKSALHSGKAMAILFGTAVSLSGFIAGIVGRRQYRKDLATYEASFTPRSAD